MSDYVYVTGTATRDGEVLAIVPLGSVERWAWDDPKYRAMWKRSRRAIVCDEACTSTRVRVTYTVAWCAAYWDESDLNDNGDLECERCNMEGQDNE